MKGFLSLFIFLCASSWAFAQGNSAVVSPIGGPPPQQNQPSQNPPGQNPSPAVPGAPNFTNTPGSPGLPGADSTPPVFVPPTGAKNGGVDDVISAKNVEGLAPRDPFRLPEELLIKLRRKSAVTGNGGIDMSIPTVRRYPLASYQLVGIIWDVNKPKAMFLDPDKKIHMLRENDFIGNAKGVITSIQNGSVTVLEGKIPQFIKLNK